LRIIDLIFTAYGPFSGEHLEFSDAEDGIEIVYGTNEAGKSSALRALRALLYGIPSRTPDAFLHHVNKMAIKGTVTSSDGSELEFIRKKKGLFDPDDESIKSSELDRILDGIGEDTFCHMFGIDHRELVSGGKDIVKGEGEVGKSLFAAALSRTGLPGVLDDLEEEANGLFRSGARSGPEILKLRKELKDIKKEISDASLSAKKWKDEEKAIARMEKESKDLDDSILELEKEYNRLDRLQKAIPKIAKRKLLLEESEGLGKIVVLPPDFPEKRSNAVHKLDTATDTIGTANREIIDLENKAKDLEVTEELLKNEDLITEIYGRSGAYNKALKDRPGIEGQLKSMRSEIDSILLDIGKGVTLEKALEMRLDAASRSRIQELGRLLQDITGRISVAEKEVGKLENEIKVADEKVNKLGPERKSGPLKQALARAQKAGDIDSIIQATSDELSFERDQLRNALSRLPFWEGTSEELETAKLPSLETIEKYESDLSDLDTKIERAEEKSREITENIDEVEQELTELIAAGTVPSEEDLERAREHRDVGWQLIKRAWLQGENVEKEASTYSPEDNLPEAFESGIKGADEVSDRLRWEANRVEKNAALAATKMKLHKESDKQQQILTELEESRKKRTGEWEDEWKPIIEEPGSPKEMRAWTTERQDILRQAEKARNLESTLDNSAKKRIAHRDELAKCLKELGEPQPSTEVAFEDMLDLCAQLLQTIEDTNRRRVDLLERIEQWQQDLETAIGQRYNGQEELQEWRDGWAGEVKTIGLGADAMPAEADAVVDCLTDLFSKLDAAKSLEDRISGIDNDCKDFEKDVEALASLVMTSLKGNPPAQVAAQMEKELKKAKSNKATLDELKKQIEQRNRDIEKAKSDKKQAEAELKKLCSSAKCKNPDDLPEAERKSKRYEELDKDVKNLESQLVELSSTGKLKDLVKESQGVDADALPAEIEKKERELSKMKSEKTPLDRQIGEAKGLFRQMDGSDAAAELAERSQDVVARTREKVEHYMRIRMAYLILREQIERFKEENEEPLLARAGELFSKITCGSFDGLQTIYSDKDEPILVGARPSGELVDVSGMSDGTVDQLYLSLRLAALEKHLESCEPMPFVVDDILIRFDDDRALATLKILENLTGKTQVIFFTHHSRLVQLAEEASNGRARIHKVDLKTA